MSRAWRPAKKAGGPLLVAALAFAASARGDADRFALSYERGPGAESCADGDSFTRSVAARVGHDFVDAASHRSIRARIERHDGDPRWTARVLVDGGAERNIASSDEACGDLGEALVLVVALVVDPDAAMRASAPEPAAPSPNQTPSPPPPPAPKPIAAPAARGTPPPREVTPAAAPGAWPLERVAQGAAVVAGVLPGGALAARSALTSRVPRVAPITLGAVYGLSSTVNAKTFSARETAFYATAQACPRLVQAVHVELSVCACIDVGRLATTVSTPPAFTNRALSTARPIVDLGGRAEVALRPEPALPVDLVAGVDGRAVLLREDLAARSGLTPPKNLSPAAVAFDLSLAFRFP